MNTQNTAAKVCLIIPYYGEWPVYFNYYLKSCSYNSFLEIIFFSDNPPPEVYSSHIKFVPSSLEDFSSLASKKLGFEIHLNEAYKICDFKPFFGLIFNDYLKTYDYWAYGDIDIIYGDLKKKLWPLITEKYDTISCRIQLQTGSLSLFKNIEKINHLYVLDLATRKNLVSPHYMGLDETCHDNSVWTGGSKMNLPENCLTYKIANANRDGSIKASFLELCKEHIEKSEIIEFNRGNLSFKNKELGYLHLVRNKNNTSFHVPTFEEHNEKFYIRYTGIHLQKRNVLSHYFRLCQEYQRKILLRFSSVFKFKN